MEYIQGMPVDAYCSRYRLTIRQRLELFRTVCEAVHYAHQNLVVHRDLKPSNILVTTPAEEEPPDAPDSGETVPGSVKLLDFGVAKLLGDEAGDQPLTQTHVRPMTLEYASPEQVRGAPITTASDVYALGVILYELLTGRRPYEVRGLTPSALEKVICETDPPRPSTAAGSAAADGSLPPPPAPERLSRRLRGDLDNIVLKALHKDPARRYRSVEQFSEDVRRHLERLPVVARLHTVGYRVGKFVRRHTMGVLATLVITVALVGGIVATNHQARVAERRFDQVRSLSRALLFDLHDAIRVLPGSTPARQLLATHAQAYLDSLYQEAGDDATLRFELAEAYERVGEIQGDPHYANLGDLSGAIANYRKAFALREALWQEDPGNEEVRRALANSYGRLGVVTAWSNNNDEGVILSRKALELLKPLLAHTPVDPDVLHDAYRIRSELGWWLIWAGHVDDGLAELAVAEPVLDSLARREPKNLALHAHLWRARMYQLDGLKFTNRYDEGLRLLEDKALDHLHALAQRYPYEAQAQYYLHVGYFYLGEMYQHLGDLGIALRHFETSLRLAEALVATDSTNRKAHEGVGFGYMAMGEVSTDQGRLKEAAEAFRQAAEVRVALYHQNRENRSAGNAASNAWRMLCRVLLQAGDPAAALEECLKAIDIQEEVAPVFQGNAVARGNLASACFFAAHAHRALADEVLPTERRLYHLREALRWYEKSAEILKPIQALGTAFDWEVHPDSAVARRDATTRLLARETSR